MSIENLLEVEIQDEFEKLSEMEFGSEKHKIAADTLAKLMDRVIEFEKLSQMQMEQEKSRKSEEDLKRQQMEEDKKDRLIKNILTGVSIGSGIVLTIWGTVVTLNFEKEGTFTSTAGRKFANKVLSIFR